MHGSNDEVSDKFAESSAYENKYKSCEGLFEKGIRDIGVLGCRWLSQRSRGKI